MEKDYIVKKKEYAPNSSRKIFSMNLITWLVYIVKFEYNFFIGSVIFNLGLLLEL